MRSSKPSAASFTFLYSRSCSTSCQRGSTSESGSSSDWTARSSVGSSILLFMYISVAAITKNSPATSSDRLFIERKTPMYCRVTSAIGMS